MVLSIPDFLSAGDILLEHINNMACFHGVRPLVGCLELWTRDTNPRLLFPCHKYIRTDMDKGLYKSNGPNDPRGKFCCVVLDHE